MLDTLSPVIVSDSSPTGPNPAAVYIASLPAATGRRTQAQALRVIAEILGSTIDSLPWHALRYEHTAMIRSQLAGSYAPATANKMLSALRGTLKQAWLLEQMTAEEYRRAVELKPIEGETLPAGRELSMGEISALMNTCRQDPTPAGTRDAAIIGMMYVAGLRREEVVSLTLDAFDPDSGSITLTGKRNKERTAYLVNGALSAMRAWLEVRGEEPGALFVSINKAGGIKSTDHMEPKSIYNILSKRAAQAGVKKFSPHDMRRTFVSDLLEAGADIATVAKMAGHSNVQTTARYDRRPEEAKKKAAELLHVPY